MTLSYFITLTPEDPRELQRVAPPPLASPATPRVESSRCSSAVPSTFYGTLKLLPTSADVPRTLLVIPDSLAPVKLQDASELLDLNLTLRTFGTHGVHTIRAARDAVLQHAFGSDVRFIRPTSRTTRSTTWASINSTMPERHAARAPSHHPLCPRLRPLPKRRYREYIFPSSIRETLDTNDLRLKFKTRRGRYHLGLESGRPKLTFSTGRTSYSPRFFPALHCISTTVTAE
ncbi:hypothetical protein B0H16DRAFT_1859747 [Mycena metata]|uniref:Uncharacterized protein n=1 Tax=Mycena metata TaxID=1033252 RepID=A0AAD7DEN3_9AGAR|nr:hypothetical protein B0H16DRAFT_1859747 [Mycena metata]